MENTSSRLKQLMRDRNLRQIDIIRLAEPYCHEYNLKLTKSDMSQFVSGKVEPGQWKLAILGRALGVSEAWLMGYDVPMERTANTANVSDTLTPSERRLVEKYRALNAEGQARLLDEADLLCSALRYQKDSAPSASTEAG